ncbi:hypothetical protein GPECTOR_20g499 [Gonium pectorale]|uniref:BTB domain-containing protein n=1 Tax=Gonium pectorale TaxID=33097 RepID=A0A150GIK5_GONPE|nr:hypothetical protein GPECTOR_20g499 [Gonium pectorale]|eukprot:KXZ49642.1 hypothetical protein GPECTOR_20g499 [Gonium pectorale]
MDGTSLEMSHAGCVRSLGTINKYKTQNLNGPAADPNVFGRLLAYSGVLDVPATQLKATLELAARLLMPEVCELLKPRLLVAACTPATITSYLLWAEQRNLTALLPALKAFFLEHCKAVAEAVPEQLDELTARHPALAAELLRTLARAKSRP